MRRKYFVLLLGGKLVTDWYLPKNVLKQLTVQSLVSQDPSLWNELEKVAALSTIDTEPNGDSPRICSNDEHVAGTTACFESRHLEVDS